MQSSLGLTGPCLHLRLEDTPSGAGSKGVFSDLSKDVVLKPKMKHAIAYEIYLNILFMVSVCVMTCGSV